MKKIIAGILCLTLIFGSTAVFADDTEAYKEESIYILLNQDGTVSEAYVVNAIHGLEVDYGHYADVINLTTREALTYEDGKVSVPSTGDLFYYQGELSDTSMPWIIDIQYALDNEVLTADALAGQSGHLKIHIKTSQGDENLAYFYNHYTLQISLALSASISEHLKADGATLVEAGGTKQIAFTVLPGNDGDFVIEADVSDFEMDAILINAVQMAFDMEVDTSVLTDQMSLLGVAVSELSNGAQELVAGMDQLSAGIGTYAEGMGSFSSGLQTYADGGSELSGGMAMMADGLSALSSQGDVLKVGISAMANGAFDQVNQQLAMMGMGIPEINRENYQTILGGQPELEPILIELENTLAMTDGLLAYMAGVDQIASNAGQLSAGLSAYVQGAYGLAAGAEDLHDGVLDLDSGMSDLASGMTSYSTGIEAFKTGTDTMEEEVSAQVDDMLGSFMGDDAPLVSFTSDDNEDIHSVQLFFRTAPIQKPEQAGTDELPEPKETLWDRIVNLFEVLLDKIGL